jgi:hypothetical protein
LILVAETGGRADSEPEKDGEASMLKPMCAGAIAVLALAAPAAAQTEDALRSAFEGKRVTLRIDMPGTSDGVDVQGDARQALDYKEYGDRLKRYGVALRAGDSATVTLVKVKKDLIEVQLAGGGFGTFGDDTSTSVSIPDARKTEREKNLEKRIDDEHDRDRRRGLQRELDDLRDRRERENRRIAAERERQSEAKRVRIAEQRLRGGSRFNLRYDGRVPEGIRPQDVAAALAEFVDFGGGSSTEPALPPTGDMAALRKGMTRAEAERAFGRPTDTSKRIEGTLVLTTVSFDVGDQRISADFVEDVLVRYTVSSK